MISNSPGSVQSAPKSSFKHTSWTLGAATVSTEERTGMSDEAYAVLFSPYCRISTRKVGAKNHFSPLG